MEDLLDLIIGDESPSEISDTIKDILFTKAGERVDSYRPEVAQTLFNSSK